MSMKISDYYMALNDLSFKSGNIDMYIVNQIKSFDFKSIVMASQICYDPKHKKPVYKTDRDEERFYHITDNLESSRDPESLVWVIYFQIKTDKKRELRADMIFNSVENLIRTSNKYHGDETNYMVQVSYDGLTQNNYTKTDSVDKLENYVAVRCHSRLFERDSDANILSSLIDLKNDILKINIRGLSSISDVFVEKENNQKMVLTMGSNISSIIENPVYSQIIDVNQITSNDVMEIERMYGVEAARSCFIYEMYTALSSNLNIRHIELLADNMSHLGELISVSRFGVKKGNNEPLHRASFEETTKQFVDSSLHTERDPMTGPSANVMFGQFIHSGTNSFSIVLDTEKLETLEPQSWRKDDVDPFDRTAVTYIQVKNTTRIQVDHLIIEDLFKFKFELG